MPRLTLVVAATTALLAQPALTGIDVLRAGQFSVLRGQRVALLTNQTGRARDGARSIDLLAGSPALKLVALFSPEHGIDGDQDDKVASSRDAATGLPVYSLYGETRHPDGSMLTGVDAIAIDLQDVGTRFYTYPATVAYVMEEAARRHVRVVVLDRPNPIGGREVEGPRQDSSEPAFTGYLRMPVRHGLTLGELARAFNAERRIGAALTVVPMRDWTRDEFFDETMLPWINPSPNIRTVRAALLYPGIGAIEGTNISVGRGTDRPFEQLGAPWIDGEALASALNARHIPGVTFSAAAFTPAPGARLGGQRCAGVSIAITDRRQLRPVRVGVEIAAALTRLYGSTFELEAALALLGSESTVARIRAGDDPALIAASWREGEEQWQARTAPYKLY